LKSNKTVKRGLHDMSEKIDTGAADASDTVCGATLLRHNFLLLTKQFRSDHQVVGYSLGKTFDMSPLVLRGWEKGDGVAPTLKDVPRRWVALDVDSIDVPDELDRHE
jgi:hypothetical protein